MDLSTIADWTGSSVVENLINTAYSYLLDGMLPADSKAELKRLQAALPQITAVMGIAETLKMKHPSASLWVNQFRQAVEASEDVLDELEYKKLEDMVKNRDEAGGSAFSSKKRKICSINDDTLERLKEAVTMLDRAASGVERLLQLTLEKGTDLFESQKAAGNVLRRNTSSFLVEREVFGQEFEKHKIIDWLTRPTDALLSSFSIVGVGGVGKTTLAQFAYQEMLKAAQFDIQIWVCVSTNFSVEDVMRKMLSETNCGKPLNALQETLKETIHSRKILLILDDIWDDEKSRDWEQLIAPLRFVHHGSKIIVTTRMKSVADLLASVLSTKHESLELHGLGEQELRELFNSYAFHGSNPDNHKDLQTFGEQILKMFRRNPLAAKVIGRSLNSHLDQQYWGRILDHNSMFNLDLAKDVVEVLKLSYYHLPEHLQVCFRFCSIFPQDHLFDKNDLIKMWITSGFIRQQSIQEQRLEDIGEHYFNLLLRKSFFEYSKSWEGERYIMNDLLHELAQNVSYGECCRIEPNDKSITIPSTVRHVSVHESEIEKVFHLENLRSLVITTSLQNTGTDPDLFILPNDVIKKPLRLLKINGYNIFELPEVISSLVHLRYLSIGPIKLSTLASIYKLYHLQVLEFSTAGENSSYLGIETTGITNLLRLRYMRLPKEIMQTIHGVHKLTSLQELTFFVGQERGQRINELGTLKNLRHLFIENIENIGDQTEAQSANLIGKNNLMSLSLKWTSESNPIHSEKIIDYLQPPSSLMELTINNYSGERSPKWMEDSPPLNLSSLKLHNCPLWKNQSFFGKIPCLKILDIRDCLNLDKLPDMPLSLIEFRISNVGLTSLPALCQNFGNNTPALLSLKSSLRVVKIKMCPNLICLHGFLQQDNLDLQIIEKLTIKGCEKLVHLPTHGFGKLTSLKYLTLTNNPKLVAMDFQGYLLPTELQRIYMGNCGELDLPVLEASCGITTLTKLKLHNANIISIAAAENSFRSLKSLNIKDYPNLIEFPTSLPLSLTEFRINNVGLSVLPKYYESPDSSSGPSTSSLKKVRIENCQNLRSLNGFLQQDNIDFQSIEKIKVRSCKNLVHLPMGGFGKFVSLQKLTIEDCPMLMAVDNQSTLLPMALKYLSINDCGKVDEPLLESASSLRSLTDLQIFNCANISRIPSSKNAFGSLNVLHIEDCKKLVEHSSREQAHGADRRSSLASLKIKELHIDDLSLLLIEPLRSLSFVSYLFVYRCSWMEALLEQWILQNSSTLKRLDLCFVRNLNTLPATMVRLAVLEELEIDGALLLEELPELPVSLRELYISDARSLKSLPATMVMLTTLERLEIWQADLLQELPEFPASLKENYIEGRGVTLIKTLSGSYSAEIAFNPPSNLIIDGCDKPIDHSFSEQAHGVSTSADWAGSSWQIANLQILDLHNFVTLDRLPDMPLSLIEFQVHNVGLTSLPDLYQSSDSRGSPSASSLKSSLRKVRISNCQNLTSLNGFLQQDNDFRFIEHIEVTNCRNLVHLPVGGFGKFVSLQALTISNCPMLMAADNHSNLLPMALKDLSIENCGEIDEPLLESVSSLATLTFLSINNCANILRISLENAFGSLSSLSINAYDKHVEHSSRKQAHGVSQGSNLSSLMLSHLEIDHLSLLLIEPLRSLRSVRNLRVWSCSGMEALPEQWFLQNSSTLSWLSIRNASTLKSLLATMERLSSLQWLEIWQADLLRELPELPTSLRSLVIRDASSLRSLPATMARLSALEWLEIWKANLLEELPELPASLKQKYIEGRGVTSQFGTFPRSYLSLARI